MNICNVAPAASHYPSFAAGRVCVCAFILCTDQSKTLSDCILKSVCACACIWKCVLSRYEDFSNCINVESVLGWSACHVLGAPQYQFQFPYCVILIIHTRYLSCLLLKSNKDGNGEENATKFVSATETSAVITLRGQAKKQGRRERDHTD